MAIPPQPAWDRFWKYDRLSSFLSTPGAPNYGEPIARGWREFFESIPEGGRILDLCTGNGAIAVLAVESAAATGRRFAVTGADLAAIQPTAFVSNNLAELRQIRFLPGVPAEDVPLESGSFEGLGSQYGIEYSDMGRSVPEAVRLLAPEGRLRFAIHAAEGSVVEATHKSIADADFLTEIDFIGLARRCFEAEMSATGPAALNAMNSALRAIAERAATATDKAMLANVHHLLCSTYDARSGRSLSSLLDIVHNLSAEITAHRERQAALLAAALSFDEMHALGERLRALGMSRIIYGEQRDGSDLIGHVIEGTKS